MATLNGVEFQILTIEWATYQNNVVQEVIGGDTVVVHSQGYRTDPVKIQGRVRNEKELDAFQEEFYSGGALTFIKDVNSGRQYQIYALGNIKQEDSSNNKSQTGIVFNCLVQLAYPYMESSEITTRSKTITTQNQEWSSDDDSNDIKTDGNVGAVPDIKITGGNKSEDINQTTVNIAYVTNAGAAGVSITQITGASMAVLDSTYTHGGQTIDCRKAGMLIVDSFAFNNKNWAGGSAGDVKCSVYSARGGTLLGSKTINVANTDGWKTFTFDTPIAIFPISTSCSGSAIYFKLELTGSGDLRPLYDGSNPYADGRGWDFNGINETTDLQFQVVGHSVKEIQQTFEPANSAVLSSVIVKGCDYNYSGSNVWTAKIYQSTTLLGTSTAATPGSSFAEMTFLLEEETKDSLQLSGGTEYILKLYPPSDSVNATSVLVLANSTSVYADGEVTLIENGGTGRIQTHDIYFKIALQQICISPEVYNIDDLSIKCAVANRMLINAIHKINVDGTGTIDYNDDFTTDKWRYDSGYLNVTHDTVNDELDVADDGYIYWKKDTKYPIKGIPTLTTKIDITAGIPTIQISSDAITWYDIDTAIIDDTETVYPLDSDSNLSLAGETVFYWRIHCVKAATATCTIKYFKLDINIHTIYAKNPQITKGSSASTFRIDQNTESGMAGIVDLLYRDKWWV